MTSLHVGEEGLASALAMMKSFLSYVQRASISLRFIKRSNYFMSSSGRCPKQKGRLLRRIFSSKALCGEVCSGILFASPTSSLGPPVTRPRTRQKPSEWGARCRLTFLSYIKRTPLRLIKALELFFGIKRALSEAKGSISRRIFSSKAFGVKYTPVFPVE